MNTLQRILVILCWCLCTVGIQTLDAQTKQDADGAYAKEQYQKASQVYVRMLQENGKSATLYFNLGDCYYRMGDMTKAVINFQRALQIEPGNSKIRHNLRLAESKVTDQITPQSEMFFITWIKDWRGTKTANGWSSSAIVAFILLLATVALYLFGTRMWLRKTGFFAALFCLLLTVVFNIFAYQQRVLTTETPLAVVTAPLMDVKSAPAQDASRQFELHEGVSVRIIDNSMDAWKEIQLADGRTGWVRTSQLEQI